MEYAAPLKCIIHLLLPFLFLSCQPLSGIDLIEVIWPTATLPALTDKVNHHDRLHSQPHDQMNHCSMRHTSLMPNLTLFFSIHLDEWQTTDAERFPSHRVKVRNQQVFLAPFLPWLVGQHQSVAKTPLPLKFGRQFGG